MVRKLIISLFFFASWGFSFPKSVKVIIDPGHGGKKLNYNDDKWDPISKRFLEEYRAGAVYKIRGKRYEEQEIVLKIAKKVKRYLDLTLTKGGWVAFRNILRKYSYSKYYPWIKIRSNLTRYTSYKDHRYGPTDDINDPFRLYDAVNRHGRFVFGRISKINREKPYLVVSLHLSTTHIGIGGMNVVLAPHFDHLDMLRKSFLAKKRFSFMDWMPFKLWFVEDRILPKIYWMFKDAWVYFNGFVPHPKTYKPYRFAGYKYNMITWAYKDPPGWERIAKSHPKYTRYSKEYRYFIPDGKFWDRERSYPERWRRKWGYYGFGGDNATASIEIMRFARLGLALNERLYGLKKVPIGIEQKPYISIWSLPTYINAICAYVELGYLNISSDFINVVGRMNFLAEGIAVGIYSLFVGIKPKRIEKKGLILPAGIKINFRKYEKFPYGNYFKIVY